MMKGNTTHKETHMVEGNIATPTRKGYQLKETQMMK